MSTFAAMLARLNDAAERHLSNATATLGSTQVPGLFDAPYQEVLDVESSAPQFICRTVLVPPGIGQGDRVFIALDGSSLITEYEIVSTQPDSGGMTVFILEVR